MNRSILQRARKAIFHPLVFAAFPILSLFMQNMGKGYLREALLITAGALVFCLVLWVLVNLLVKDAARSAILVSVFFLLFLSFGHALSAATAILDRVGLLERWWVLIYGSAADIGWLILWGLLLAAVAFYVVKRLKNVSMATDLLNVVSLALVLMLGVNFFAADGFQIYVKPHLDDLAHSAAEANADPDTEFLARVVQRVYFPIVRRDPTDETAVPTYGHVWLELSPPQVSAPSERPDIYYIVLDMYARSDVLRDLYDYDNSDFLAFLEEKGFYVARESTANYPYTTHSLASSLNYMYVDDVVEQVGQISGHSLSAAMIGNSRLFDYLSDQGYTTITFATGYWFTELKDSDIYLAPAEVHWNPSEFQVGLIELTPLSKIAAVHATKDQVARRRVLFALDHLADATEIDAPTLVFAHINAPHDPWVFGADGRPVASKDGYTYDEYVEAYREQAAFVSWRAQQAIEEILSRSATPPIIILQSDHGACYGPYEEHLAQRMSILNAIYFPDQGYEDLYQTISPVNTYRVVLNRFLGTDYELLEDRNYYSSLEYPYDFVDVTEDVSSAGH
jgi:hypothetical protein